MKFADDEHLTPFGIWLKRKLQGLFRAVAALFRTT